MMANKILAASCEVGRYNEERERIAHILFVYYGWKVKKQGTIIYIHGESKWICRYWNLEGRKGQMSLMEYSNRYPIIIKDCKLSVR